MTCEAVIGPSRPLPLWRVFNFHRNTLRALSEMIAAAGLDHPSQIRPHHLVRRVGDAEVRLFSQLHVFLEPGELLDGQCDHDFYDQAWALGRADSFDLPSASGWRGFAG